MNNSKLISYALATFILYTSDGVAEPINLRISNPFPDWTKPKLTFKDTTWDDPLSDDCTVGTSLDWPFHHPGISFYKQKEDEKISSIPCENDDLSKGGDITVSYDEQKGFSCRVNPPTTELKGCR